MFKIMDKQSEEFQIVHRMFIMLCTVRLGININLTVL